MNIKEQRFVETVWEFWRAHGRHDLPWRQTTDPYLVTVSEIMLQQTQVERVIPKYDTFVRTFPDVGTLASAPLGSVLKLWQGLGYNRRAKLLQECAKKVALFQSGSFPETYDALQALPGIGPYTAGAIMAFAFNKPVPIIETNIRSVYLHHFFPDQVQVIDGDILTLVSKTIDERKPRQWYWALMDYGSYLKKQYGNQNRRSQNYKKQSVFKGSDRQIRGAIIKELGQKKCTGATLKKTLKQFTPERLEQQLNALLKEGLVTKQRAVYQLPD